MPPDSVSKSLDSDRTIDDYQLKTMTSADVVDIRKVHSSNSFLNFLALHLPALVLLAGVEKEEALPQAHQRAQQPSARMYAGLIVILLDAPVIL
eukprot:4835-Pleurochrysis_carterae.AAC.3